MGDIMKKAKGTEWLFGVSKSGMQIRWRVADNIALPILRVSKKQAKADISDIPIEELKLSVRAYHVLKANKLETVKAVITFGLNNIIKFRNAGIKTVGEISDGIEPFLHMSNNPPAIDAIDKNYDGVSEVIKPEIDSLAAFEESIKSNSDKTVLNTPIEELNLSVRALNALNSAGLKTVKDIVDFGLSLLKKRKNVGRKTITNIKEAILAIHKLQKLPIEETSFVGIIDDFLTFITPKYLPIIQLRYGYDDGKSRTLEEIGNKIGVTRERVRQIVVKENRRIKYHKGKKAQILIENIERVLHQYNGIVSIKDIASDAYFALGSRNQIIFLTFFLEDAYKDRYKIIDKKFLTYLNDNEIEMLHSKIREAALKCQFPIDEKDFYENILSLVGSISEYYLSYHLLYRERIEISKGKIISPGRLSIPDRIKIVVKDIDRPLHFSEIAKLYRNHFGEAKIRTKDLKRAIHARISDSNEFIIVGTGTFILRSQFKVPNNIEEIVKVSKEILQSLKNISDTKYLINELKRKNIDVGGLNEYSLKPILVEHPEFVSYKKFEIGLKDYEYERKSLTDLIYELLVSAKKPLHAKEVWKIISKKRGFPRYSIEQKLCDEPYFIKVAPATYTVKENIDKYEEKQEIITNFAKEWICLKRNAISTFLVSEVLKEAEEIKDLSIGLVEHILATSPEFIRLPNGFYDLATK